MSPPPPAGPLFVTGASGFVGRRLLQSLRGSGLDLRAVVRAPDRLAASEPPDPTWRYAAGHLEDPSTYRAHLAGARTVLHLAATTGKAPRARHFAINLEGTRTLLGASREAGVSRFVFTSSIAAGFADRRHYPYAEAKRRAERAVAESGLDFAILRPTMIFGPGSPLARGIVRLAAGPVGIRFGRGDLLVQPIHVDDVVAAIRALAARDPLGGVLVEAGGPDRIPLAELLARLREAARGRRGPFLSIPVGPVRAVLALLEPVFLPVLPFTAGQLASFVNPGVAAPPPAGIIPAPTRSLDAMLAEVGPSA